jgi:hypothetical protein
MTNDGGHTLLTADEIEGARAELCDRRDELVEDAAAGLMDVRRAIEENDLDDNLAESHYPAVMVGVDEIISHLFDLDEAELRELGKLAAIPLDDRTHPAVDDPLPLRPAPVPVDPATMTFDDDDPYYEIRQVLVDNVDAQAFHLRHLADGAAELVSAIGAIGRTGDVERAIAALGRRDEVISALQATFTAWDVALAKLDAWATGSAGIASEMIETTDAWLRDKQDRPRL